jgi:hypothetical protein
MADWTTMGRGKGFDEVLDNALDRNQPPQAVRAAHVHGRSTQRHFPVATHSFFPPLLATNGTFGAVVAGGPRRVRAINGYRPASPPPPPARTLSAAQQKSLDVLIGHGAQLDANFTHAALRAAFRSLARRFHPDRHHMSSDGEKARLSTLFASAHAAYEILKSAAPATLH